MSEDREKELLRLAEAVSDGTPVDWEQERGSHPGIQEPLEHLAVLDRVRQVHEESSRVLIAAGAKGRRGEAASTKGREGEPAGDGASGRRRPWAIWVAIALILAAVALALFVYSNAAKAAR